MLSRSFGGIDLTTIVRGLRSPGIDPRVWVSYALVEKESADDEGGKSVEFTTEYGPLVNVRLQPIGMTVRCRVASDVAGNGEGGWFPFLEGDEVIVILPEGSEKASPVIIGRLNQEIDAFPTNVGGSDVSLNNFGFKRYRTPFIVETAASYLIRSATTGSFIGIDKSGNVTVSEASGGFMHVGADFLGFQDPTGDLFIQVDLNNSKIKLSVSSFGVPEAFLELKSGGSTLNSSDTFTVIANGNSAVEHVLTTEAAVALIDSLFTVLGAAITALGGAPLTGVALGALFSSPAFAVTLNSAIALTPFTTIAPFLSAIQSALSSFKPLATPAGVQLFPGIGASGFLTG